MKNPLILALPLLLLACQKAPEPVAGPRPALIMTISGAGANQGMTLVGEVKARYESAQGFRIAGKILERKVEIGSRVKKGQVLARLDSSDASLNLKATAADVAAAEAQLVLAKSNLERQRQLHAQKFVSAASLDSFEAQYKSALARLDQTRAQTSFSGNQSAYTALTADRDGIVTDIRAEPGQVVAAGEVIARIVDPTQLEVQIPVPESRMSKLNLNDEATVRLWAKREKQYQAKIREIAPAADAVTRTFLVKVSILDADEEVRLGMTAGVRINKDQGDAFLVPSPAVSQIEGKATVWLVGADNKVSPQKIEVASYREDGALVTNGLQLGDKLVIAGTQKLIAGQTVRPVEASFAK